jgi:hypothetical protein
VSYHDPALRHHSNEVAIAQPLGDVPANAQLNDLSVEHLSAVDGITGDRFGHSEPLFGVRILRESPPMHRSQDPKVKQRILDYNQDDCVAMRVLLDSIRIMPVWPV